MKPEPPVTRTGGVFSVMTPLFAATQGGARALAILGVTGPGSRMPSGIA
jgi:hypothetical protein